MLMKIVFAALLLIHGLIHLLGFVKEWKLMPVSQLSGTTLIPISGNLSRVFGIFWLLAALSLVLAIPGFLLGKTWWWMPASSGVLLSQFLIILYWKDARAGTVANLIIIPVILIAIAGWRFENKAQKEIEGLWESITGGQTTLMNTQLPEELPHCVHHWLRRSGALETEEIQTVRLRQAAQMRSAPDGKWMPLTAEQYFTIREPAFIWKARIQAAPLVHIAGRDKYQNGRGQMLIKLLSIIPLADASGKEIDQGTLLRFLAETVWFPGAALAEYIRWETMDSLSARATMRYGNLTASGVFTFNEAGDVISFEAPRYYQQQGQYSLQPWSISMTGYDAPAGIRIPVAGEVTWKLESGNFTWFRFEISQIEYNHPATF